MVGERMRSTCADDMNKMGLEVISFTIKEVRDKNEYITQHGPARRRAHQARCRCGHRRSRARYRHPAARRLSAKPPSPKRRPIRSACSPKRSRMAKQAEAQRDLEIKKAEYLETIKRQQAQADKAYEIQTNIMQQQVIAEAGQDPADRERARNQGAGRGNSAPRPRTDRDRAEAAPRSSASASKPWPQPNGRS